MKKKKALIVSYLLISIFFMNTKSATPQLKLGGWKPIGPNGGKIIKMAFGQNSNEVYALVAGLPGRIFRTVDGGLNWVKVGNLNENLLDIAISPMIPSTIFVLGEKSIFKSTNQGLKWTICSLPKNSFGDKLGIHQTNPNTIYIAGTYLYNVKKNRSCLAIIESTNGGENWKIKSINPQAHLGIIYCISLSKADPNLVFVSGRYYDDSGRHNCIFKSNDSGNSWTNITGPIDRDVYSIAAHPSDASKAYIKDNYFSLYRTTDGGNTWEKISSLYGFMLTIDSTNPAILFLGGSEVVYRSIDGGVSWAQVSPNFLGGTTNTMLLSPNAPAEIPGSHQIYIGSDAGIFKTDYNVGQWIDCNAGIPAAQAMSVAVAQSSPITVFSALQSFGLFKSIDSGTNWTRMVDFAGCWFIDSVVVAPNDANIIYILTYG